MNGAQPAYDLRCPLTILLFAVVVAACDKSDKIAPPAPGAVAAPSAATTVEARPGNGSTAPMSCGCAHQCSNGNWCCSDGTFEYVCNSHNNCARTNNLCR
jgi:hypothetical protein